MYTHCPNCNTHFSITQEYLDIANGKVRCGKCDHVFNALENLYNNDEDSDSPQLETAVSIPEEQPSSTIDTETAPAQEAEASEPQETEAISPEHTAPEKETTQANAEPEPASDVSQTAYTPPLASIDIKEKMERIAASLSAATQELKNARKSVGFERQAPEAESTSISSLSPETVDNPPESQTPVSETETEIEKLSETRFENDNDEIQSNLSAEEKTIEPENQPLEIDNIEAETETTDNIEPVETLFPVAETVEVEVEVSEPEIQDNLNTQEEEKAEDKDSIKEDETESLELPALEDELELVDFSEHHEAEPVQSSATGHATVPVDESDIDILQSLIETQGHEDIAPENLIEELNDINKSLSHEDISLDDELDNGDDILAELDQLEQEFNTQDSKPRSETETEFETDSDSTENDFKEATEHAVAETTQSTVVPVVEEEVVPSFLNQYAAKPASPVSLFGWLFATLLMLLLLAAQYLHFNSTQLSDNPDYRPFLETLCPITGCILPLRKAPDKIITVNHDVHTHPSTKGALEIQLSFRNKADFTQQYPILEVIFSNPRGEIIARRQFSPDEYLNSNVSYIAGIKPNQTEKIDLEIVDPDPGALLSFQFNYL